MPDATLHLADCLDALREIPDNSVEAVITDPPYGLSQTPDISEVLRHWLNGDDYQHRGGGFMGKSWDSFVPGPSVWRECFRVLKPGGHLVSFASTRTVDLMGISLRLAGFEIRDTGAWLFWSGFPKSLAADRAIDQHLGKLDEREVVTQRPGTYPKKKGTWSMATDQANNAAGERFVSKVTAPSTPEAAKWHGYGTALKPAHEPWVLARKPLIGTVAANVLAHGTGALNVDACRYAYGDPAWPGPDRSAETINAWVQPNTRGEVKPRGVTSLGRKNYKVEDPAHPLGRWPANVYACPKASRSERERGCEGLPIGKVSSKLVAANGSGEVRLDGRPTPYVHNNHPTVKPVALMRWLCRLVGGQPGSTILDPFLGSGTTAMAAILEGFHPIGIERESDYMAIAKARISWACRERGHETAQGDLFSPQEWQTVDP